MRKSKKSAVSQFSSEGWPNPGSATFAQDFKSNLRNILLASPFYSKICLDQWESARPNSLVTKLLRVNHKKNLETKLVGNIRTCSHIKVTGVRCGSPALRGEQHCFFHHRMLKGLKRRNSRISPFALLENEEAIQCSIMEITDALLKGQIDLKRGELILRALNTAVRNARRVNFNNLASREIIRELPKELQSDPEEENVTEETRAQSLVQAEVNKRKPSVSVKDFPAIGTIKVAAK